MSNSTIVASRYRVLRELGRGGMGVVYVVEHVHTGDHLALKLLMGRAAKDPHSIERFKREARASARIKSEHIVKVVDADVAPELEGAPFLVMELLNGTDLQKQLETRGHFAVDEALHYLFQAARALDKSHAIGIVHRDLKPENLFLHQREDGSTILKILDFGISKIVGGDQGNDMAGAGMTRTGAVMGTPLYMSPEQARGRIAEISAATDVWAMGLIAIQLLSGEVYWRANTVAELMAQILSEPLYAPSQRWAWLTPAVDAWFARSCARDPSHRFASVGAQIAALAVALGRRAPEAAPPSDASPPWSAATPSVRPPAAPLPPGARTTTSATVEDGGPHRPARSTRSLLAVGVSAACAVAGLAFFVARTGAVAHEVPLDTGRALAQQSATTPATPKSESAVAPPLAPKLPATGDSAASGAPDAGPGRVVPPGAPRAPATPGGGNRGSTPTPRAPKPDSTRFDPSGL